MIKGGLRMTVAACLLTTAFAVTATAETRTYYIAVDEVDWDYAPTGINRITGRPFGVSDPPYTTTVFVERGKDRIGRVYRKARYREYTDGTFSTIKSIPPEWEHLGILGPVIRAEVGDTIRVIFKNNARFPFSVHPHGVFYTKDSEGAPYDDGTSGAEKKDDAVPPGGTHTYLWLVPERAGPGPNDPSSILWMYHSHTDESRDTNTGLIGPMIISARGTTKGDGTPKDVDREFVTLFTIFDENVSFYLDHNIKMYTGRPATVERDEEEFIESNLMHTINGLIFGNVSGLTMKRGERVRWYMMGLGNEVDLHTPHWHGQTLLLHGSRTDMVDLLPAMMKTMEMVPDNPGTWLFHCHVNDHLDGGMVALFTVTP